MAKPLSKEELFANKANSVAYTGTSWFITLMVFLFFILIMVGTITGILWFIKILIGFFS